MCAVVWGAQCHTFSSKHPLERSGGRFSVHTGFLCPFAGVEEKLSLALGEVLSVRTQESGCWDWPDDGELRRHR